MERRDRNRKKVLFSFCLVPGHPPLLSLRQKAANERTTVAVSALSSMCQQKIQMNTNEGVQTCSSDCHEAASYINMLNDSEEALISCLCWRYVNHKCNLVLYGSYHLLWQTGKVLSWFYPAFSGGTDAGSDSSFCESAKMKMSSVFPGDFYLPKAFFQRSCLFWPQKQIILSNARPNREISITATTNEDWCFRSLNTFNRIKKQKIQTK